MRPAETHDSLDASRQLRAATGDRGLRLAGPDDLGSGHAAIGGLGVSVLAGRHRTIVRPRGELDMSTSAQMETSLQDALATSPSELVLDLHGLAFCDAAGLQVFLRARRAAFAAGAALWLERPTSIVRRVLEVSGLAWLVDDSAAPRRVIS